jgi:hypothetical protein
MAGGTHVGTAESDLKQQRAVRIRQPNAVPLLEGEHRRLVLLDPHVVLGIDTTGA